MNKKVEKENYNIYFMPMDNFKTVAVSVCFRKENKKKDDIFMALLRGVLSFATGKYHDLDDLTKAKMEIYDPRISFYTVWNGNERLFCIDGVFANEKYTEQGMNVKAIRFILDYFWNPYVKNGAFDKEIFNNCKRKFVEGLKSLKDDPDDYIKVRIWEKMDIFSFNGVEEAIKIASEITEKDLYEYYLSLFNENLNIFIAGDVNQDELVESIDKIVKGDFTKDKTYKSLVSKIRDKVQVFEENMDTDQSKLALGFKFDSLTEFEKKYVSEIYTTILGNGWNSKLNKVVREQNSLCYYIYTNNNLLYFNSCFIYSGIAEENYDKVIGLIKQEIENMKKGLISDDEIKIAKDLHLNSKISAKDSQIRLLGIYIHEVFKETDNIDVQMDKIKSVTKEDIQKLAKKIHIDTIYFLRGNSNEGK